MSQSDAPRTPTGEPPAGVGATMEQSRRSRVDAITPERDPCSLLVLRLGYGRRALLAVSFHGVRQTTALLAPVDAAQFLDAVAHAAPLTADQRRELAGKLLDHR